MKIIKGISPWNKKNTYLLIDKNKKVLCQKRQKKYLIKLKIKIMKKEIYPKYITKVKIKPTYTIGENILFYILSFATLYGLLYALCMILTLINTTTL